ncbi:MAG: hypothetical protein AVDCRST_MAG16-178, partial [uncultured Frankineae bacterium]
ALEPSRLASGTARPGPAPAPSRFAPRAARAGAARFRPPPRAAHHARLGGTGHRHPRSRHRGAVALPGPVPVRPGRPPRHDRVPAAGAGQLSGHQRLGHRPGLRLRRRQRAQGRASLGLARVDGQPHARAPGRRPDRLAARPGRARQHRGHGPAARDHVHGLGLEDLEELPGRPGLAALPRREPAHRPRPLQPVLGRRVRPDLLLDGSGRSGDAGTGAPCTGRLTAPQTGRPADRRPCPAAACGGRPPPRSLATSL